MYTSDSPDPTIGSVYAFTSDRFAAYACVSPVSHYSHAGSDKLWRVRFSDNSPQGLSGKTIDFAYGTFSNIEQFVGFIKLKYVLNNS